MRVARTAAVWSVALLGLGLLPAGAAADQSCTYTISTLEDARAGLTAAAPGDMLCFVGPGLADVDLTLTRSGTPDAPISLVSDGRSTVHQTRILADHVIIRGFTMVGGGELLLSGVGITAQKNTIRDTERAGIVCSPCTDSVLESNTVTRAATTGIFISGQRITVRENLVSETVPGDDGDADGIRFFGDGHRIISNSVRDILAAGSSQFSSAPDCLQTLDTARPPTFGIVIVGNACENVAGNCLTAAGDESGNSDAPDGTVSITFIGNTCVTNGDQAVSLRSWPDVDVRKNKHFGPSLKRGVLITDGSTGCTVKDNATASGIPAVEIDDSSRPGFNSPF